MCSSAIVRQPDPTRRPSQVPNAPASIDAGKAGSSASLPEAWTPPSYEVISAPRSCSLRARSQGNWQGLLKQREKLFTADEKAQAWSDAAETVKIFSDEMIERWNSEIDTYLVYAGLFSAIVTAFNVQSYLPLQQTPDPTLAAILQISLQLSSLSINPPFLNSTHPAFGSTDAARAGPAPGPPVGTAIVALNALWFSSLVLSLSSASVGIMVKQWLNAYKSGLSSEKTSRETRETRESARVRQYRLNNLIRWRVEAIVLAVP
ncbi:hypothetical protein BV20DRAFT_953293, partial [Pilatotrama ljubarskyi]